MQRRPAGLALTSNAAGTPMTGYQVKAGTLHQQHRVPSKVALPVARLISIERQARIPCQNSREEFRRPRRLQPPAPTLSCSSKAALDWHDSPKASSSCAASSLASDTEAAAAAPSAASMSCRTRAWAPQVPPRQRVALLVPGPRTINRPPASTTASRPTCRLPLLRHAHLSVYPALPANDAHGHETAARQQPTSANSTNVAQVRGPQTQPPPPPPGVCGLRPPLQSPQKCVTGKAGGPAESLGKITATCAQRK
jgi:hypothetical protein